uniref:Protein kinase domain-containing protein n=1 Tax=Macrostomum lignano TaxID=282301 RepID=A0A1I8F1Y2_9PLAT
MPPTLGSTTADCGINCFKEKKLKQQQQQQQFNHLGKPAAGIKRKVEEAGATAFQQQQQQQQQAACSSSKSDGDYRITVGEELRSSSHTYEVMSFLGRGTFGQVVKGWRKNTNELVAIKILKNHPSYARQGSIEIHILQQLSKRRILTLIISFELWNASRTSRTLFELLEQNLYDYLKAQKISTVLAALAKLKSLGLIHADLKPENIMLVHPNEGPTRKYRVKVIDFGSACYTNKAVTLDTIGHLRFSLACRFNESIDMWSLGCVIAELFMGWPLYPGSSEYDQIRYIVETQGYPPAALLKVARKTNCFFSRHPYSYEYQLKSPEQYLAESGVSSKEVRKFKLAGLDQIRDVTPPDPDTDLERADRVQFSALLKKMLCLEGKLRICPDEAIAHPFITMPHLQRWPQSQLCMESETLMQVCYRQPATCLQPRRQQPPPPHLCRPPRLLRLLPLPTLLACLAPSIIHPLPLLCRRRRRRLRRLRHRQWAPGLGRRSRSRRRRSSSRRRSLDPLSFYMSLQPITYGLAAAQKAAALQRAAALYQAATFAAHGAASTALAVSSRQHRHPVQVAVCHPFNVKEDPYAAAAAAAAAAGLCPASLRSLQ